MPASARQSKNAARKSRARAGGEDGLAEPQHRGQPPMVARERAAVEDRRRLRRHLRAVARDVAGRHAQPPLSRGSSRSRSASPSMLKPKTASDSAAAGQIASHGARYMWSRPVSESMPPHVG